MILLLDLSKFENQLQDMIQTIIKKKSKMWHSDRDRSAKAMTEISEFFQGNRNWDGEMQDEDLAEYFAKISEAIMEFEYRQPTKVGRRIQKIVVALEDLQLQHAVIEDNV